MFRNKTLFVVGAGASAEVNLPTGNNLRQEIAYALNIRYSLGGVIENESCRKIEESLQKHALLNASRDWSSLVHTCRKIADSLPTLATSIDTFIDTHSDDQDIALCGKLAIAQCIIEAEKKSYLIYDYRKTRELDYNRIQKAWLIPFFQMLHAGIKKNEVKSIFDNLSVICFNYDRCIEHFLLHALKKHFFLDNGEAQDILNGLQIIHPYGSLGSLTELPFGGEYGMDLLAISKRIKTFSEQIDDAELLERIRGNILAADKIIFIGFGFHKENMKLLELERNSESKKVYATADGFSNSDCDVIKKLISKCLNTDFPFPDPYHLRNDLKCFEFFEEFRLSISG